MRNGRGREQRTGTLLAAVRFLLPIPAWAGIIRPLMPKHWWSSRSVLVAQAVCLLALFAWSVHHVPAEPGKNSRAKTVPAAFESREEPVIDNSEDTASTDSVSGSDPRFVAPPTINFRTEHPPAGSLNLRPLDSSAPDRSTPWQPVHPQNPPQRLPSGPRSPFEVNGSGATVYNAPPPDAD